MKKTNIFALVPEHFEGELTDLLINNDRVQIERIISKGHTSPASGWCDQEKDEWVMVLKGSAIIVFENDSDAKLGAGDYLNIPAHTRHKVSWTDPELETVWLAIHY